MPAPLNAFKQKLNRGDTLIGCWIGLADAYAAEVSATAGFDWLLIDGEHAPNDLRSILAQLQIISASPSAAVVRVAEGNPCLIKQVLDIGAQSILVPMVESGEQARALVEATRYPPDGIRGVGSALARASRFSGITDYLVTANDQICLLVQVETRKGLDALDDILATDGVDGVFIGPADLAADMGFLGNPQASEVQAAITDALLRINASGKAAGILALDPSFAQSCFALGARFVAVGIDVTVFAHAMRSLVQQYAVSAGSDVLGQPPRTS